MSIERVFVAGAGLMGHGIAQVHASIGTSVTLYEPDLARAEAGKARIAGNLQRAVTRVAPAPRTGPATLDRIVASDDLAAASDAPTSSSRPCSRTAR